MKGANQIAIFVWNMHQTDCYLSKRMTGKQQARTDRNNLVLNCILQPTLTVVSCLITLCLKTFWSEGMTERWRIYQIMKTWWVIMGRWHILLPCQWHGVTEWKRVIDLNYCAQMKVISSTQRMRLGDRGKTSCIQIHSWIWLSQDQQYKHQGLKRE